MNESLSHEGLLQQSMAKAQGDMRTLWLAQMQVVSQHERCECHDCTQARWKMFAGGGLAQMGQTRL